MNDQKTTGLSSPRSPYRLPWWIFILLAIGSYCTLKYVVPGLHLANSALQKLVHAAPAFAAPSSILFLLLAAKRLYDTDGEADDSDQGNGNDADNPEEK